MIATPALAQQHGPVHASQPSAVADAATVELQSRLETAKAAKTSGNPGSVANASSMVIAAGLREMAALRAVEGAYPRAEELYKDSLRFEQTPEAVLSLATVDAEDGRYQEAIQLAEQVHRARPADLQADRILSSSLIQQGKYQAALEALNRVALADPRVDTQYALATCLLETKRPEDKVKAQAIFRKIAEEHGDTGSLHVLMGRAYRDAGDLPDAVQEFQKAIAIDTRTPHAHYFLGLAKLSLNEWRPSPDSEVEIQKEAEFYPKDYLANYMTGFLASGDRRYADAEPYLKAAATLDPTAPEPYLFLGLDAYAQNNDAAAEAALRKAVELTGKDESRSNYQIRRAYVDLGRILAKTGHTTESEMYLGKARDLQNKTMEQTQQNVASMAGVGVNAAAVVALAQDPAGRSRSLPGVDETASLNDASLNMATKLAPEQRKALDLREKELRSLLALAYNDLGTSEAVQRHYPEAVGLYRRADAWDGSLPGLQKNLGQSEFRAGDYEASVSPLAHALLEEPRSTTLRAMLGIAYFDLNRYSEAANTFAPLGNAGMQDAQVGYAWAASLAHTGDVHRATEVLTAYAAVPQSPDVQLLIGQLWTALGDYPRAVAALQGALSASPSLPRAHFEIGMAYLRSERWPDAAKEFEAELALRPGNTDALYHLGYVHLQQGKVDQAVPLFEEVIASDPRYANAQYQLGKIQLDRGEVQQSIAHLEAAERSSPHTDYIHYQLQAAYRKASRSEEAEKELAIYKQLKASAREQAADRVSVH